MAAYASAKVEDRFDAAVKIIHSLPKEGPFQQSNDTKLEFYGLYKQATIGQCNTAKPGFWEPVNRAKWDAWKSFGDLSPEQAKEKYINLLAQIVETMTLDDSVQEFVQLIGPVHQFVEKDKPNGSLKMSNGHVPNGHNDAQHSDDSGVHVPPDTPMDKAVSDNNEQHRNGHDKLDHDARINKNKRSNGSLSDFASEDENYADAPEDAYDNDASHDHNYSTRNTPASNAQQSLDSSASADERETTIKHVQWKRPSEVEDGASRVVGTLLRNMPEFDNDKPNYDQLLNDAWEAAERAHVGRETRFKHEDEEDSSWFPARPRRRKSHGKRVRGKGDPPSGSGSGNPQDPSGQGEQGASQPADMAGSSHSSMVMVNREGGSNSSEESSLSRESPEIIWDPQVAAVLYRMHKDVQQLRRQMDLVEGVLLTQQRMVTATLNNTIRAQESRGWFFSNLPLRTISFIIVWPFLVNFIIRLCWTAIQRRRRRF